MIPAVCVLLSIIRESSLHPPHSEKASVSFPGVDGAKVMPVVMRLELRVPLRVRCCRIVNTASPYTYPVRKEKKIAKKK